MVIQDDESPATAPADSLPEVSIDTPLDSIGCPPDVSVDSPSEAPVGFPPAPAGFPPVEATVECPSADASVREWLAHSLGDNPCEHCHPPPQNEASARASDEDDEEPDDLTTTGLPFKTKIILLSYTGDASIAFPKRCAAQVFISVLEIMAIIAPFLSVLFHSAYIAIGKRLDLG